MGEGGSTSSRDREMDASSVARQHGLLLLGADQPLGSASCLKDDCRAEITPTDICCSEHGDILGRQPPQPMTWAWFVRLLPGFVAMTAIPFAARYDTPFIVFGIWSAIGAAICWLVAFRWHETGRVLPIGWCVAAAVTAVIRLLDMHPEWSSVEGLAAWLELVLVTSAIGVSLWLCFRLAAALHVVDPRTGYHDANDEAIILPHVGMTRGVLTAVALCVAAFVSDSRLLSRVSSDADAIAPWLWRSALFSTFGTVLGVLGVCLFRSWAVVDTALKPLVRVPDRPHRLRWSDNFIARASQDGKRSLGKGGGLAVVTAAETVVHLVLGAAHMVEVLIRATINKVARFLTLVARHIAATLRFVLRTIISSGRTFLAVLARYSRGMGIPGVAIVAATYATWYSATHELHYLHDGPISDVALGAGFGLGAAFLVFVAWGSMTGEPVGRSARSVKNLVEYRGGAAVLFVVAAGLIDGVAGGLGAGPMRVGPITVFGGILLIVVTNLYLWNDRRQRTDQSSPSMVDEPSYNPTRASVAVESGPPAGREGHHATDRLQYSGGDDATPQQ
jgi:hypothetical protein